MTSILIGASCNLQTKPHGHGDVHALLHSSGLAAGWAAAGVKWVCFFQDTNGLVFRALPAALGAYSNASSRFLATWLASCAVTVCDIRLQVSPRVRAPQIAATPDYPTLICQCCPSYAAALRCRVKLTG